MDRMVQEFDLPKLGYLNMVIKESMRPHPVGLILGPYESIEDITIDGYNIPKNSRIIVNSSEYNLHARFGAARQGSPLSPLHCGWKSGPGLLWWSVAKTLVDVDVETDGQPAMTVVRRPGSMK
ncbi:hypothetical protein ACLB2K_044318 [Fragaria x ananassa]